MTYVVAEPGKKPPPAPAMAAEPLATPLGPVRRRVAVVVGISEYGHRGKWQLENLRYASADAKGLSDHLVTDRGGGFDVFPLMDSHATSTNIKIAIRERLRGVQPDDFVLIFWAGHGCPDPHEPEALYLITYDTDPEHMAATAYSMDEFRRDIASIRAGRVMVIADACHSGGIFDPTIGIRGRQENAIVNELRGVYVDEAPAEEGQADAGASQHSQRVRLVFTSCEQGEVSQERSSLGHGVFTYFLLEGLQGEADKPENKTGGNGDGMITLGEVIEYTRDAVKRATENQQHPATAGPFDRKLSLGSAR